MFGMLDYRAHKLYWLLTRPLVLASYISYIAVVVAAIAFAQWTEYPGWLQLVVGYAFFEGVGLVVYGLWALVFWLLSVIFFWLIDVVPSEGLDREEARTVVTHGKIVRLGRLLDRDMGSWDADKDDTNAFLSLLNWRARWFFGAKERMRVRIRRLKRHFEETGEHPGSLTPAQVKTMVGHLDASKFENFIASPMYFKSLLAFSAIAGALLYLNSK